MVKRMKCKWDKCNNPVTAKGFCATHYRYDKVRRREESLKSIIEKSDTIKAKRPDLAEILDELTREARSLFREFQPKSTADEVRMLREELEKMKQDIARLPSKK